MSAELLLREFARIGEAPEALPRLRRFVLDLAVRGLLVPPGRDELPADALLAEILTTSKAVALGSAHRRIVDEPVADPPFAIPARWTWTRLGRICEHVQRGKSPIYSPDGGPLVVSQKCVRWEGLDLKPARSITPDSLDSYEPHRFLRDQDLLWNSTGTGTIGRVARVQDPPSRLVCDSHVTLVRCPQVDSEYVRTWLRSDHVFGRIEGDATGSTNQVELTLQMALGLPIPLPPLAEQHRIVAKVEEFMVLCDQLEAAQKERELGRDGLRAASLQRLTSTDGDGTTRAADIRFFLRHSARLMTQPEDVAAVRQKVLDLAVRGRLVPQDPMDEPAADLLKRIAVKRDEMLAQEYPNRAEARTQQTKQSRQVVSPLLPNLPVGWKWATLMQCSALIVDCRNKTVPYASSGITLLRTTNVRGGQIVLQDHRYVSEETYMRWSSRYQPQPGDIAITREAPMGEVAKIPPGLKVCLGQRLMLARLVEHTIDADFLVYSLRDSALMERVQDKPIGALVEHLRVGGIETLLVPLPPLMEQRRIVGKLVEMMDLCDELEAALASAQDGRVRLLEALLREALKGGAGPEILAAGAA